MTAKLYCFGESGNAYKVALALTFADMDWAPEYVDFFNGAMRTPEFRAINEMGEVPVLVDGEEVLSQSGVILDYLAQRFRDFAPASEAERREVLRWLFWDNHKLSGYMATYRYYRAFTPSPDPAVLAYMRRRLDDYLTILNGHLLERPFMIGDRPTIADISMMAYLSFPKREAGYDLAVSHPAVNAWLLRMAELPGWRAPYDLLPGKRLTCYV